MTRFKHVLNRAARRSVEHTSLGNDGDTVAHNTFGENFIIYAFQRNHFSFNWTGELALGNRMMAVFYGSRFLFSPEEQRGEKGDDKGERSTGDGINDIPAILW